MDYLILDENKNILCFLATEDIKKSGIKIEEDYEVINYKKLWPVDLENNKLPKNMCYWNTKEMEVKAKTQEMIDEEIVEMENIKLKDICVMLNKIMYDCATYDDLKTKIAEMIG